MQGKEKKTGEIRYLIHYQYIMILAWKRLKKFLVSLQIL